MPTAHGKSKAKSTEQSRLAWWQWLLMYPALAVAAIGAIPTVVQGIEALRLDTSYGDVPIARRNVDLFDKNFKCLGKSGTAVKLGDNTQIEAAVCDNGDIWIRATTADNQSKVSWVTPEQVLGKNKSGLLFTPAFGAALQVLAQTDAKPLCVFRDKSGKIVRRVIVSPGNCRDEQIDPATGRVTTVPAECNCPPGSTK